MTSGWSELFLGLIASATVVMALIQVGAIIAALRVAKQAQEMMRLPKDTPIVFYCHLGQRSLDAASYFAGHGFTDLRSMTGGIEAWSLQVDPSVPRYELASDTLGGATLRPLRSAVSQVEGYQSAVAS